MSDASFRILFEGKIKDGEDLEKVKAKLARLFKKDAAKIASLFGSGPLVIRKGLDYPTAQKYKIAIERAGGLCRVEEAVGAEKQAPAATKTRGRVARNAPAVVCPNCGYHFINTTSVRSPALSIKYGRPMGSLWKHT
jgi:hypothetical protein